jgi:Lrp/AsnC family transcriptional regulator, leucine-responsive regulatory protein
MNSGRSTPIDDIDRRIIAVLSVDGRISIRELADKIGLSSSATSDRLHRLETTGVISGYRVVISPEAVQRPFEAVIGVTAITGAPREALEVWLAKQPCVSEVIHLSGPHDYLVRAHCKAAGELDDFLMTMKSKHNVGETETRIVLRSILRDRPTL